MIKSTYAFTYYLTVSKLKMIFKAHLLRGKKLIGKKCQKKWEKKRNNYSQRRRDEIFEELN